MPLGVLQNFYRIRHETDLKSLIFEDYKRIMQTTETRTKNLP